MIFADIKMIDCLERERFSISKIWNFGDVLHGSAIFENQGATSSVKTSNKTTLKGRTAYS